MVMKNAVVAGAAANAALEKVRLKHRLPHAAVAGAIPTMSQNNSAPRTRPDKIHRNDDDDDNANISLTDQSSTSQTFVQRMVVRRREKLIPVFTAWRGISRAPLLPSGANAEDEREFDSPSSSDTKGISSDSDSTAIDLFGDVEGEEVKEKRAGDRTAKVRINCQILCFFWYATVQRRYNLVDQSR